MTRLRDLVLYASLALGANVVMADTADLAALREGSMRKLVLNSDPIEIKDVAFTRADGSDGHLSDYAGKHIVLNFWATWCAPCRKEMPHLSELQAQLGGEDFEVVTIATGRNPEAAIVRFFEEIGVTNLPMHRDPRLVLSREMAVLGLPVTVILNPEGQEIARLRGDADWASDSAKAIITALIDGVVEDGS